VLAGPFQALSLINDIPTEGSAAFAEQLCVDPLDLLDLFTFQHRELTFGGYRPPAPETIVPMESRPIMY